MTYYFLVLRSKPQLQKEYEQCDGGKGYKALMVEAARAQKDEQANRARYP